MLGGQILQPDAVVQAEADQGGVTGPGDPVADLLARADLEQPVPLHAVVVDRPVPPEAGLLAVQQPLQAGPDDPEQQQRVQGLPGAQALARADGVGGHPGLAAAVSAGGHPALLVAVAGAAVEVLQQPADLSLGVVPLVADAAGGGRPPANQLDAGGEHPVPLGGGDLLVEVRVLAAGAWRRDRQRRGVLVGAALVVLRPGDVAAEHPRAHSNAPGNSTFRSALL